MIRVFFKTIRDEEFKQIEDYRTGSWIVVEEATLEDLKEIATLSHLDISDLHDSLDKFESPRIEHTEGKTLIFIRHPAHDELGLHTATLTIILTNTHLITISPCKSFLIDSLLHYRVKLATTQKSKLLFHILLRLTYDFTNKIKAVRHAVTKQEQRIKNITNEVIIMLTKNEDILNQYLSSLIPMRNVLEAIAAGRYVSLYEKDYDLMNDLLIAIKQSEDLCRVNVKSIRSLRDSYQIQFTNDVNKTIKFLTAITIIFTIPTIIASIYGMNVSLPFEKNPQAFSIIMYGMLGISFIALIIFARKKWL